MSTTEQQRALEQPQAAYVLDGLIRLTVEQEPDRERLERRAREQE